MTSNRVGQNEPAERYRGIAPDRSRYVARTHHSARRRTLAARSAHASDNEIGYERGSADGTRLDE
jgi:hypothetical protein